ncbi:MAG TPA: glutamate--tRNA ligase [Candidatus Omnitrophota bacterium]|nr:glutamate--tRNA ligase [Candidatus Omnitrophota bacterium]
MIRVRFAPSPTGYLHIGGARTALFNWMYARSQNGTFILRIEDTDQQRSKKEFEEEILTSMKWLGLLWDELYHQSERFDVYRQYADKLIQEDKAYKDGEAVILKIPQQEIKLFDLIRGEIAFDSATIKDQVLIKSDGSPTYSFACVVDDALMEISHVIRGEDHISNTPKQMMIYQALGLKAPKYAHLPLIMGEEGRLSKRTGAVAVSDYKKEGFLPEALVNYLMLLGWSPGGNQEVVDIKTALKNFSIKKVNKAAAIFSMEKLEWINGQYIKKMDDEKLVEALIPFLKDKNYINGNFDRKRLKNIVKLFKGRLSTLTDFLEWADFVFVDEVKPDEAARKEHLSVNRAKEFELLRKRFAALDPFDAQSIEAAFRETVEALGLKSADLVHPIRVALTGRAVGPGLFETIEILGKEKTIQRLSKAF